MKKFLILCYLFVLVNLSFSQNYKYAWITDLHIGAPEADNDLRAVVDDINKRTEIKFVVATGDISEKGRNSELESAKQILDLLKVKYYIIPGNHDTKWSESGCTKFLGLWGDDKFQFEYQNTKHIGLNSGIPWRGGGGHVSVEQIDWYKKLLQDTPSDQEIVLYVHHPLDGDVDNWHEITNLLVNRNIKAIFVGHGHSNSIMNFQGIPAAMGRSSLSRPKFPGYTIIDFDTDSIRLSQIKVDSTPEHWGSFQRPKRNIVKKVDSTDFIKYDSQVEILWQKNLNKSVTTALLVDHENIFAAAIDGSIECFDLAGNIIWENKLGRTIFSRPAAYGEILAVATIEGDLYTLNKDSGEILQVIGVDEPITSQLVITDAEYNAAAAKALIFGTTSGKVYCYELNNLEYIWESKAASAMIETLPLAISNKIIFGSWDSYLYCLDKNTGSLIWKWTENENFYYSTAACWPVTDGKKIYVTSPDRSVSAIDLNLGTTEWRKNDFNCWESIGISQDKKKIFIKSILDKFYIISASDGRKIKEVKVGYSLDTMPNQLKDWAGKIIFGSKNGKVYLIDREYNSKPLLFMGTARIHTIEHLSENTFAASNMDGKIVVFKVK